MHVLVVEDRPSIRQGLVELLEEAGHDADAVEDGVEAIRRASARPYDVVILDLMLPGRDGLDVCRRIRGVRPDTLILMLTAKGSEDDKVAGFVAGADDYVVKPFGSRELLARLEALVRRRARSPAGPAAPFEVDGCRFDLDRHRVVRDGATIDLTAREAAIVRLLRHHDGRAVTRAELLEEVWGVRGDTMTRTVDVTVAKLRRKIERDPSRPVILRTVKGVGYAWAGR